MISGTLVATNGGTGGFRTGPPLDETPLATGNTLDEVDVGREVAVGALVVAFWLWGIIVNLLLIPGYFDIALRDFGLSLGALALARLARHFGR